MEEVEGAKDNFNDFNDNNDEMESLSQEVENTLDEAMDDFNSSNDETNESINNIEEDRIEYIIWNKRYF